MVFGPGRRRDRRAAGHPGGGRAVASVGFDTCAAIASQLGMPVRAAARGCSLLWARLCGSSRISTDAARADATNANTAARSNRAARALGVAAVVVHAVRVEARGGLVVEPAAAGLILSGGNRA